MEAHYTKYHKGQNATDAKTKVQFTNDRPYQLKSKSGKKLRTLGEIDREVIKLEALLVNTGIISKSSDCRNLISSRLL